jgi:hypothetical protein
MKRNWSYETHDHGPETGIETVQAGRSRMNQTDPVKRKPQSYNSYGYF